MDKASAGLSTASPAHSGDAGAGGEGAAGQIVQIVLALAVARDAVVREDVHALYPQRADAADLACGVLRRESPRADAGVYVLLAGEPDGRFDLAGYGVRVLA